MTTLPSGWTAMDLTSELMLTFGSKTVSSEPSELSRAMRLRGCPAMIGKLPPTIICRPLDSDGKDITAGIRFDERRVERPIPVETGDLIAICPPMVLNRPTMMILPSGCDIVSRKI